MQVELSTQSALLSADGSLAQVGWARQPLLDCNLEKAAFYPPVLRFLQPLRIKRWDYYALFTPLRFFSATIADLGYAANIFVYTLDFKNHELHEESLIVPSPAVRLPRNSTGGASLYQGKNLRIEMNVESQKRCLAVDWPAFNQGSGVRAEVTFHCPDGHESMNIVIPIGEKRFYYNRKINCMPAEGSLRYGAENQELSPRSSIGSLDWGRGVWDYHSFWNWASASSFLPDGRSIGLNLGSGFGDLSRAGENAVIIDGRMHKLDTVRFEYDNADYMSPWHFTDSDRRLELRFTPFKERIAKSNLLVINSEVHQMFGHYDGWVVSDYGETIPIQGLIGCAEEHRARW